MEIEEITSKIRPVLAAYGVTYAAVFGSFARGQQRSDSDLDLLVTLEQPIGVFSLARLKRELEEVSGKTIDLVTTNALSPRVSPYILSELKEFAV